MIATALVIGFALITAAILLNLWRLFAGPTPSDRILALDTLVINAIALTVMFGIYERTAFYFEAGVLLALVGFVSSVAYAKFLLRGDIVE
ncbi:K+/H+ antiporter subunit F [Erythrobacteraceae bacterium CFH 75059]|uniref:K+/H+ antiporter subunit F n=1 Tax=Qipengyuania thermophila TaxID=2509361 RepID=UPI0010223121|nr:K+/H+ antiporter subunit F [Qipengyuania thermophila]TCD06559.1 K+/H+ antiporter subunit F [Erythrobacteraceae bacterium CFH 75059]